MVAARWEEGAVRRILGGIVGGLTVREGCEMPMCGCGGDEEGGSLLYLWLRWWKDWGFGSTE